MEFIEDYPKSKEADKPFFLHCSFPDPHHPVCPPGKYKTLYKPEDIELPSNFTDVSNLLEHQFLGPQGCQLSAAYTPDDLRKGC